MSCHEQKMLVIETHRVTGGRHALQPQSIEGGLQVEVLRRDGQGLLGLGRRRRRGLWRLLLLRLLLDGRSGRHEVGRLLLLLLLSKVALHHRGLGHLLLRLLLVVAIIAGLWPLIRGWVVESESSKAFRTILSIWKMLH